ncbi:hypothetical protein IPP75_03290 [Candidatus Saccharibacteria bacterium]|nr:MAG: hypothetical protein IPP75_03290 [Candidatus Saccharibacteria bacterium]
MQPREFPSPKNPIEVKPSFIKRWRTNESSLTFFGVLMLLLLSVAIAKYVPNTPEKRLERENTRLQVELSRARVDITRARYDENTRRYPAAAYVPSATDPEAIELEKLAVNYVCVMVGHNCAAAKAQVEKIQAYEATQTGSAHAVITEPPSTHRYHLYFVRRSGSPGCQFILCGMRQNLHKK